MNEPVGRTDSSAPVPLVGHMTVAEALVAEQKQRFEAAFEHGTRQLVTSKTLSSAT